MLARAEPCTPNDWSFKGHVGPQYFCSRPLFKAYSGMASNQAKVFFLGGGACALDKGALVVSGRVGLLR